ncbi:Hypothetical protein PHPALM_15842 [Phytophthora palmivora]|uniref:Retrotransposon gag domain-containing protein n=1 Tax=Phytophthora palmivora TaxID=4796 RepID=A0A2P4XR81_9STRA|nr:Hypothetical protein PHPALM_15842 [Phytophthora palmivora]
MSARSNPLRKKLKAPGSDADDQDDLKTVWTDESLEIAYHKKELHTLIKNPVMQIIKPKIISDLKGPVQKPTARSSNLEAAKALLHLIKESGITAGSFDANDLFDTSLSTINTALMSTFDLLKPLVGEKSVTPKITTRSTDDMLKSLPALTMEDQTGTSHYESATEDVDTDSADDPPRMTLGPSDQASDGCHRAKHDTRIECEVGIVLPSGYESILEGTTIPINHAILAPAEDRDVDMESVGSLDRHPSLHEYDPDDLDLDPPRRVTVASASATTTGRSTSVPRIRVSAMSELKEFAGREGDEDRARAWLSKVKSAFMRDQAPDEEKCLVFGDLLAGSARNWYRQLSRITRSTWKDLLSSFQVQYCGRGVSVARQYYHARKRSDESPLEYLYRLNVAGLRARLQIKDGPSEVRREHVEHFIETLDDRDLADHLALLRIPDADTLEEALRSRQRAKARQSKAVYGSIKPRQKNNNAAAPSASTRAIRAVKAISDSSESEEGSSGSDGEVGLRRVYLAASGNNEGKQDQDQRNQDHSRSEAGNNRVQQDRHDIGSPPKRCSHCGSRKHSDLGCWGRLTCEKCGRKADRCLFTCKACGDIHEAGKCAMEEF